MDLHAYFSGHPLYDGQDLDTLVERFRQFRGNKDQDPLEKDNSGNILLILKSEGNTPNFDPGQGYTFSLDPMSFCEGLDYRTCKVAQMVAEQAGHENVTVHGSLNRYESNTVFAMFYPYAGETDVDIVGNIETFLDKYHAPVTGDRFTIKHPDVFFEAVNNSSEIFMSDQ